MGNFLQIDSAGRSVRLLNGRDIRASTGHVSIAAPNAF